MIAVRLLISGHVQGIGYRDWLVYQASRSFVDGWVRNLGNDRVEAVLSGDDSAVEALIGLCWRGPPGARVAEIERVQAKTAAEPGFRRLPSV